MWCRIRSCWTGGAIGVAAALLLVLIAAPVRAAVVFADGNTHTISGPHGAIEVRDSNGGATTTVNIIAPAELGCCPSVVLEATNGGQAVTNISGGALHGVRIGSNGAACISGAEIGAGIGISLDESLSLSAIPTTGTAFADISGGTFGSAVEAGRDSTMIVSDGIFGQTSDTSVSAFDANVQISGGDFERKVFALSNAQVAISGGVFSKDEDGTAAFARGASMRISGGGFAGKLVANLNAHATVTDGLFGFDFDRKSVYAYASTVDIRGGGFGGGVASLIGAHVGVTGGLLGADFNQFSASVTTGATLHVQGGTFAGKVNVNSGGAATLSGGSWGKDFDGRSVSTFDGTVDIFGGSYSGGFFAGPGGVIDIYGFGLFINGVNEVVGTLADGTPIQTTVGTGGSGKINLHQAGQIALMPLGFELLSIMRQGSTLILPGIKLPPPTCDAVDREFSSPLQMVGAGSRGVRLDGRITPVGSTAVIIRRLEDARNPGETGSFQVTVPIELVALQLRSANRVDLSAFGLDRRDFVYVTLQDDGRGGRVPSASEPASQGQMAIDFALQRFQMSIPVFFDVRVGSPDGQIVFSGQDVLSSPFGVPFSFDRPGRALELPEIDERFFAGPTGGTTTPWPLEGQFLTIQTQTTRSAPESSK